MAHSTGPASARATTEARVSAALLSLALLGACEDGPRSQIVVRLDTDMTQGPGARLEAVDVRLWSQDRDEPRWQRRVDLGSDLLLPADLIGTSPRGDDASRSIRVEVDAIQGDDVLFTTRARAAFVEDETVWLTVFVADGCRSRAAACDETEACGLSGCGPVDRARLPNEPPDDVLWSADLESGLAPWQDGDGSVDSFGDADATVSADQAHGGSASAALRIRPDGEDAGAFLRRTDGLPRVGRYEAWFLVDTEPSIPLFWALMQFGSPATEADPQPSFTVNLGEGEPGDLSLYVYDHVGRRTVAGPRAGVVPGTWFHVEVLYERATDPSGRVEIWLDGEPVGDLGGVATARTDELQWAVSSTSDELSPPEATVYVDDLRIQIARPE